MRLYPINLVSLSLSLHACYVKPVPDKAQKETSANQEINCTESSSRLRGKKIAVKDNICTKEFRTTCSSAMLAGMLSVFFNMLNIFRLMSAKDFVSPIDATVVTLLQRAGASVIGKTNCDEFGMGSARLSPSLSPPQLTYEFRFSIPRSLNTHSIHGPVVNPFRPPSTPCGSKRERRSAGGSSGGSAAAVASGACDACVGLIGYLFRRLIFLVIRSGLWRLIQVGLFAFQLLIAGLWVSNHLME